MISFGDAEENQTFPEAPILEIFLHIIPFSLRALALLNICILTITFVRQVIMQYVVVTFNSLIIVA